MSNVAQCSYLNELHVDYSKLSLRLKLPDQTWTVLEAAQTSADQALGRRGQICGKPRRHEPIKADSKHTQAFCLEI